MNVFKMLCEPVARAIKEFGLGEPTKPQELATPEILSGKHVLLIAPTGTGKTEAALLPVFSMYLSQEWQPGIKILYIAPLRALNRDMLFRLKRWGDQLGLRILVRHGDTSGSERHKQVERPPDMLITTPETLQAILPGRRIREHLKSVRWVIIDEIHELAEDERGTQLVVGLERLSKLAGEFQRIGLSATIGSPSVVAQFLVGINRNVEIVDASVAKGMKLHVESPVPKKEDAELADRIFAEPTTVARLRRIRELMNKHGSTLAFVNTREAAEILGSRLRLLDARLPIGVHHGSLAKEVRIAAEEGFRNEQLKCLICTSSMELGIDIGTVDLVVQYMSPRQVIRLVQRVGRSGHHVDELSHGIVLATNPDDAMEAAVISRRALAGSLELSKIHEGALDVLAHQLVGLSLDQSRVDIDDALTLIKRAYPYHNLSNDKLIEVLEQLSSQGLIWLKGNEFWRRMPAWEYYFTNLSMISDTKRYRIDDIASRKSIGTLDEEFVATRAEPGITFICKGETWQVIDVEPEEKRVLVEPAEDPLGAIPAWEGELIPVPFEVAQEVGKVRAQIAERLKAGDATEHITSWLIDEYPISKAAANWFVKQLEEHARAGLPIPTNDKLVIEIYEQFAVLHACFGTLVNKTLGLVLAVLLSTRFGTSIAVKTDPYRIAFRFPMDAAPELLGQMLKELKPEHIGPILQLTLKDSSVFKWRLLHVAKRFGAIRKDAGLARINLRRLAKAFEATPIHEEAMREVMLEKLDITKTIEIARLVQTGAIELTTITRTRGEGPTQMGWPILDELTSGELIVPKRAELEIIRVLRHRLNNRQVRLFCMNCYSWNVLTRIGRLPELPECGRCGARLLTLLPKEHNEVLKVIRKRAAGESISEAELQLFTRARKIADLILTYGKRAIITLAGRGIGARTAARILAMDFKGEIDFYKAILQAERVYARTRRFWGD